MTNFQKTQTWWYENHANYKWNVHQKVHQMIPQQKGKTASQLPLKGIRSFPAKYHLFITSTKKTGPSDQDLPDSEPIHWYTWRTESSSDKIKREQMKSCRLSCQKIAHIAKTKTQTRFPLFSCSNMSQRLDDSESRF